MKYQTELEITALDNGYVVKTIYGEKIKKTYMTAVKDDTHLKGVISEAVARACVSDLINLPVGHVGHLTVTVELPEAPESDE